MSFELRDPEYREHGVWAFGNERDREFKDGDRPRGSPEFRNQHLCMVMHGRSHLQSRVPYVVPSRGAAHTGMI